MKHRENILFNPATIEHIQQDAKEKSISKSAVVRQIVEGYYKQQDLMYGNMNDATSQVTKGLGGGESPNPKDVTYEFGYGVKITKDELDKI